jgi:curved DNA-binding protein CbpA
MNYYTILGISNNSSEHEIKNAYRKLILIMHPDKNISKTEHDKNNKINSFVLINEAYNVLKEPNLRKIYNEFGCDGIKKHYQKEKELNDINEARERNRIKREEREKRQKQKELEELKRKRLEEEKKKDLETQLRKENEKKRLEEQQKRELREKNLAEKRQKEIELEIQLKIEREKMENEKKTNNLNMKIKNKNACLINYSNEFYIPFKDIILRIDKINILDIDTYILSNIIVKTADNIIYMCDSELKEMYLKLKEIQEYFNIEYNDTTTNQNIRGKIMLKRFLNLCSKYSIDKYIVEQYEEHLKKINLYDSYHFCFLQKITLVYIKLIESIVPNVYFL